MPVYKTLIILANSRKHGGRCLAGREVLNPNPLRLGDWIRLVPDDAGSEAHLNNLVGVSESDLQPLNVVQVPIEKEVPIRGQPENAKYSAKDPWRHIIKIELSGALIAELSEEPSHLWDEKESKSDRVAADGELIANVGWSLVMLRVSEARFHGVVNSKRLHFVCAMGSYDLKITDEAFTDANTSNGVWQRPDAAEFLVCISLGEPFSGHLLDKQYHFKLVATILPIP